MDGVKITFQCPGCEETIGFPASDAGTVQECPECGGWVDVPEVTRTPIDPDRQGAEPARQYEEGARQLEESARQLAENARLLEVSTKSHQEWQHQLEQAARSQDAADALLGRVSAVVRRWEDLAERFEKVVSRWEQGGPR